MIGIPRTLSRVCAAWPALAIAIGAICLDRSQCLGNADDDPGARIFAERCASCHGKAGQGSEEFPRALAGDKSVAQLTRLIARTMPEDDPGTCVGKDAENVAAYIFDAFYSPIAQARIKPPRIELSRLTVRQYRNAVADLIGSFKAPGAKWDDKRGLRAEYFKGRQFRGGNRVIERVDPEVKFDFAESSPEPEKIEPHEFSIRWNGSVFAPDTGEYEFIIHTEHAARLWINDNRRALIDAWVKSGSDTEYRATIHLIGGRAYPLRLEFSKAKQGVDDSKDNKKKPPSVPASIALLWKPPGLAAQVIPRHCLSPSSASETFVVETPFPPDDSSVGYERGASVSKAWDQATTDAAIETANFIAAHLGEIAGVRDSARERDQKAREFCHAFAERAFRRPLSAQEKLLYVDRQFHKVPDANLGLAVKRAVLLTLKSPRFLYRELGDPKDPGNVASRLALMVWDSLPDQALIDAARAGTLNRREEIVAQVNRMLADPRAHAKIRGFLLHWLRVDRPLDLAKDASLFPGFDADIVSDLRSSLDLFLDDVVWSDASSFRRMLLADEIYLNGRLAAFYKSEMPAPADAPFQKVAWEASERSGVLTHPYLMATFAYTAASSPIHRGVFLARSVLGRSLRPPPEAVAPLIPDLHPDLTTRERVALQTSAKTCMSCHSLINSLGFGLEHFDATGRYRKDEKSKPIDATGAYQTREGETQQFTGARELARFLADSPETRRAFASQLFHHMVQQPIRAYGPNAESALLQSFAGDRDNIRQLVVEIVALAASPPADSESGALQTADRAELPSNPFVRTPSTRD